MDYEIVFDGSHRGNDSDLLCCSRLPEKRFAPPISSDRPRYSPSQRTILTALEVGAATVAELIQVTGLTLGAVRNALDRLRESGDVEVRAKLERQGSGAAVCVYAIKPERDWRFEAA